MNLRDFLTHLSSEPAWSHAGAVTPLTRASNGDTPLHAAIWARDDEAARQLIDAGADVNAAGEDGYTPIHAALAQSNVPLARRLTACGASWNAVNKFACSVRDAARRSDDPAVRALLEQEEVVSSAARPDRTLPAGVRASQRSVDRSRAPLPASRVRPPARGRTGGAPRPVSRGRGLRPSRRGCLRGADGRLRSGVEFYYTERFAPQADGSPRCFRWSTAFRGPSRQAARETRGDRQRRHQRRLGGARHACRPRGVWR